MRNCPPQPTHIILIERGHDDESNNIIKGYFLQSRGGARAT